jgi:hypothetical protein
MGTGAGWLGPKAAVKHHQGEAIVIWPNSFAGFAIEA